VRRRARSVVTACRKSLLIMAVGCTARSDSRTSQLSNMASNFSHWFAVADTLATPVEEQPVAIGKNSSGRRVAARHASSR
jgi:hypothetical protein